MKKRNKFNGKLVLGEVNGIWELQSDLIYQIEYFHIIIPAGFKTDGTTLPPPLRCILSVWGKHGKSAVLHDYLYHRLLVNTPHPLAPDRKTADRIFRESMIPLGISLPMRYLMWGMVRIFGGFIHKSRNERDII